MVSDLARNKRSRLHISPDEVAQCYFNQCLQTISISITIMTMKSSVALKATITSKDTQAKRVCCYSESVGLICLIFQHNTNSHLSLKLHAVLTLASRLVNAMIACAMF